MFEDSRWQTSFLNHNLNADFFFISKLIEQQCGLFLNSILLINKVRPYGCQGILWDL